MKSKNKGMTIIELIIVIAILGILTLAVAGFLSFGLKGYDKINEIIDEQAMVRLAANRVTETLRNARGLEIFDDIGSVVTSGVCYIYVDEDNNLLKYGDDGNEISLSGDKIGSIFFEIIDGSKVLLNFEIIGDSGFDVESSILLNNFGDNIDVGDTYSGNITGSAVSFTLPTED